MDLPAFDEMLAPPAGGRMFEQAMRPGLSDCAPSARMRLDGLARWLQDVAYADVEDAGLADAAIWVLRRTRVRVQRFPTFGEHMLVRTFCSGVGRMWAERRTTIARPGEPAVDVETVSLWVHLDPVTRLPTSLSEAEISTYGATGVERRVSARLRHPAPTPDCHATEWTFRATDCDLADHVNNAAYWQPLEQELIAEGEPARIEVEIEFRTPCQPGEKRILADGQRRWITSPEGEVHASVLLSAVAAAHG